MKKNIALLFIAVAVLAFAGCDGSLHNTPISYVTLKVVNLPVPDGTSLSFCGGFNGNSWDYSKNIFTVTGGAGEWAEDSSILASELFFSITAEGDWLRPWFPATEGNEPDYANGNQNFSVEVPMDGGSHLITVDGSTIPATVTVE